jgi:hypothetical protein
MITQVGGSKQGAAARSIGITPIIVAIGSIPKLIITPLAFNILKLGDILYFNRKHLDNFVNGIQ